MYSERQERNEEEQKKKRVGLEQRKRRVARVVVLLTFAVSLSLKVGGHVNPSVFCMMEDTKAPLIRVQRVDESLIDIML